MLPTKTPLKIAIVDDHNLFRKGLIKLISLGDKENKYSILFEAENGNDLKDKLKSKSPPDIILMDIDMPDLNGYEAVDWLRKYHPDISILVVSMFETEEPIMRMLRMGVKGYLSKDIEVEDMHQALEAIANKGFYYSDLVSGIMAQNIQSTNPEIRLKQGSALILTENEREFLKLACTELTYSQIADRMNLSPKTIDGYRESLFQKFQVKSRVSLAMYAVKNNLVKI
ncbi:response regulator transcription factor [Lacibacter luteus]|uniref:Response regulator transcription factor n=1 Tax=Lacibacter luteus TaxID=2508719 RepID=A0A4Q1CI28_9BACT|nr:response regulator transcription factor [Lacibacter luteus]RXK60028.1 response regulator transcription factor [Lacibacter luteus]